jgi:hypothetical protein
MSQETLEGILDVNDPVGSLLQVVLPDRTIRRGRHAATARHLVQAGRIRQSVTPGRLKLPASL